MYNFTISFPIILYIFSLLKENENKVKSYLAGPFYYLKVSMPLAMLMSLMVIHISGIDYLSHYQGYYAQILAIVGDKFQLYGSTVIRRMLSLLPTSMITWKFLLLQRFLVMQSCPELLTYEPAKFNKFAPSGVLDIDGHSFVSYSDDREGSRPGFHRRRKGKPTLQGSASFIGNIFVDFKLFSGETNVCVFFQKAVKRVRSMGYRISMVRADTIYGHAKNLLFLERLSLHYIMGINISLTEIQKGITQFAKLSRKKSKKIIHMGKGSAILYLGKINIAKAGEPEVKRYVLLCRRIQRKKKHGKRKVQKYYYAIVTDLPMTARQMFRLYHQRQKIENGFKELIYHYGLQKLVSQKKKSLKANEFWIVSKIFAMTMAKLFVWDTLSVRYRKMRRKTLLRQLFGNTIKAIGGRKVYLLPKPKHLWHIQRTIAKINKSHFQAEPFVLRA